MKTFVKMSLVTAMAAAMAPASAGPVVWPDLMVQLHGAGHAYLVDPATDAVVADLATCKGGTLGTTTPDGKKVYVSCAAEGETEMVVIDLASKSVAKRIATGNRPKHGVVSPDGKWVGINHWGLDGGKLRVTFLDTATDNIAKVIDLPVGGEAKGVTSMHNSWSNDSRYFFTVDRVDKELAVVDTKDWSVREIKVASQPHYPVPSPDGKELWLVLEGTSQDDPPQIVIYDIAGDMAVKATLKMSVAGEPAVEGHHGNFTQDGKYFLVLNRGPGKALEGHKVVVYDAATKAPVTEFTTGSTGIGHAYNSPDGRHTMITNYGNNVVTIVDLQTMKPVKDLMMGTGRMGHAAYTKDGRFAYVSNDGDGNLFKVDMQRMEPVAEIKTGKAKGGGQVLNVWTNVFEELPR